MGRRDRGCPRADVDSDAAGILAVGGAESAPASLKQLRQANCNDINASLIQTVPQSLPCPPCLNTRW